MAGSEAIFVVWSHVFLEARSDIADGGQLALYKQALLGVMLDLACCSQRLRFPAMSGLHSSTRRRRSALEMTETDDRLIAAAAIMGDKRSPVTG